MSAFRLLPLILGSLVLPLLTGRAAPLEIVFEHIYGDRVIGFDRAEADPIAPTRIDYLLAGLAFQKPDGAWSESNDWFALISGSRGHTKVTLERPPVGDFQAIRFLVGLPPEVDASDPNTRPPGHPLHPQVNKLHWGWQGGYVFLALEGRYRKTDGSLGSFTYHVANDENLTRVHLPVSFDTRRPSTIRVRLAIDRVLRGVDIEADGESTHSREGDPLASRLSENIAQAFSVSEVRRDRFQDTAPGARREPLARRPPGTRPYPLRISTRLPQVPLPADNPLTMEGVALGRRLFSERKLSKASLQSCASCHHKEAAFTDPNARFSKGVAGVPGRRNAMPLFNLAWHDGFFWDGRASSLREQALMPIENALEMNETLPNVIRKLNADREYPALFQKAFGSEGVTAERIGLALEQFLITLVSQDSTFDRAARGEAELNASERRGLALFVTEFDPKNDLRGADCFHCHGGNLFTTHQFLNNGLDRLSRDQGRYLVTGDKPDKGKFKTPSLRNIALTAPYMHDGRFDTLEEVIEHYNSGVKRSPTLDPNLAKHPSEGLQLSERDKTDLVAFLKTLTDASFLADSPEE